MTKKNKEEALTYTLDELKNLEDAEIIGTKGLNQYEKLQMLDIKHGRTVIDEAALVKAKFVSGGMKLLDLCAGSMFVIRTIEIAENAFVIQGTDRLAATNRKYRLFCRDDKCNEYDAQLSDCDIATVYGYEGRTAVKGEQFRLEVPRGDCELSFFVSFDYPKDGDGIDSKPVDVELNPIYAKYLELPKDTKNAYITIDGFIFKRSGRKLKVISDNSANRLKLERSLASEMIRREGLSWIKRRASERKLMRLIEKGKLENRVAFVSTRADDKLLGNMENVYAALDLPKQSFAKLKFGSDPEKMSEATQLIATSKLVVTDDYLPVLRRYRKKPGQHIVQLWHATGAGKRFGQDGSNLFLPQDRLYHRDYDVVTVSSEGIRAYYAGAFDIPQDRIVATGVARTDVYFDEERANDIKERILNAHVELKGKRLIMYAPTFRDLPGVPRSSFTPELDFDRLSKKLKKDSVFVVCPHPLMTDTIVKETYDNVMEIRDVSSNDMMFASDMLITDYSSVMFEYALLGKPMAFYCYDYDSYERDFYMDFDRELPGPLLRTQDELEDYLTSEVAGLDYSEFREKYLGACDGHSTERICKLIKELYNN